MYMIIKEILEKMKLFHISVPKGLIQGVGMLLHALPIPKKFPLLLFAICNAGAKDYCITGRTNPISCAFGLR